VAKSVGALPFYTKAFRYSKAGASVPMSASEKPEERERKGTYGYDPNRISAHK
jgi:hypothetical protein